jgi:hemerythrin-like metal-binding protein
MELMTWANGRATRAVATDNPRKKLVTWSNKLTVGVKVIDEQHMELIELVNQLSDAMYSGRGQKILGQTLTELEEYVLYHFDTEEQLMLTHKYSESAAHKSDHGLFTETVKRFRYNFDFGHLVVPTEMLFFLREWIVVHIMKTDRELGLALNRLGVK